MTGTVMVKKPKKKHTAKDDEMVLWTEGHFHGNKGMFLVASKDATGSKDSSSSLSYLGAMVDVQYHIRKKDLIDYAYKNKDAKEMLKRIGRKELTRYFASESMIEIMSSKRKDVGPDLKKLIQDSADKEGLGVQLIAVNLLDAHPPIKEVAPSYQEVIGARQRRESLIYNAEAYEAMILPAAKTSQQELIQQAKSYRYDKIKVAEAESERFKQQLIAYQIMPQLYKLRAYLTFLENDCTDIRKYILSANTPYQIYEINLEQKPRLDLIDTDLGDITN